MNLIKEPFICFLLIGISIFLIDHFINDSENQVDEIVITTDDIQRLQRLYAQNWNELPNEETLDKLIDEYINSEIFYKEALKLNLDHNDEIIKRRLRQKYEFVAQDLADIGTPDEAELRRFYTSRKETYLNPGSITFFQFYTSPDVHKDSYNEAVKLKSELMNMNIDSTSNYGDISHLARFYENQQIHDVTRNFGNDFSAKLFGIENTGWTDPLQSGYGHHIVYIEKKEPERELLYEEAKNLVLDDWKMEHQKSFQKLLIEGLRKNYKIVRQDER